MDQQKSLAQELEQQRPYLRGVAYRVLGSLAEADDAVQETWLRASKADRHEIRNLRAWLTTIIGRVALNMLRARKSRREEPLEAYVPDPVVGAPDGVDPEQPFMRTDEIGLALLVVLETLSPDERLAFVLHDMFAVPFREIAAMVDRTATATRRLASRARRRVREHATIPERDVARQREVVDAYFAAAHDGDLGRLVTLLDPEVALRADGGSGASVMIRGAKAVAMRAVSFTKLPLDRRPALVNGAAGVVVFSRGQPFSVMGFTVVGARIVEIDILADRERLRHIDLSAVATTPTESRAVHA